MSIIILALIIILFIATFSVQNAAPVSISFLFWKFEGSLAIVIFLSALAGAVIASIVVFWLRIRRHEKEKKPGT